MEPLPSSGAGGMLKDLGTGRWPCFHCSFIPAEVDKNCPRNKLRDQPWTILEKSIEKPGQAVIQQTPGLAAGGLEARALRVVRKTGRRGSWSEQEMGGSPLPRALTPGPFAQCGGGS